MYILNYIFTITQYFSQDVFNITLILAFLLALKYWKILISEKIILIISSFILYALILTCFVENVKSAMVNEIYIYTIGWLLPFVLGYCIEKKTHKKNIVIISIYVFIFLIIIGFLSCFGILPGKIFGMRFSEYGVLKINAIWHVPFAARCILVLIVSFTLSLFSNFNRNIKLLLFIFSLILYLAILLSTSRIYLMLATISLIAIFSIYTYKIKNLKLLIYLFISLITMFTIVYFTIPTVKQKINRTSSTTDKSLVTRINMYKYSLDTFKKYPVFGIGPGQAAIQEDFHNLAADGFTHTHLHSIYLHILANYGILGFLIVLYLIITILYKLYNRYRTDHSIFALSMLFVWIVVLFADNFDFVLKNYFTASLYFWFTGLALSPKTKEDKD